MKLRQLLATIAVMAVPLSTAAPAAAAPPGPVPRVVIGDLTGPTAGPEGEREWTLAVDAVDPDGSIWEVVTRWDDGEVSFASTFCLQGTDPGTPAHLLIPHTFATLGRHRVQVRATSVSTCAFDPSRTEQSSRPYTKIVTAGG